MAGRDVEGIAIHIASRVSALAGPGLHFNEWANIQSKGSKSQSRFMQPLVRSEGNAEGVAGRRLGLRRG